MLTPYCRSLTLLAVLFGLAACDVPPPAVSVRSNEQSTAPVPANVSGTKERQMEFLNRIREADPQQRTIDRAMLNEKNELGLILDRSVEMDKVPTLLQGMLIQMAKEFPGQDLTVLAYTPSNPPHKIGTAHLAASTRDMSYTPAP